VIRTNLSTRPFYNERAAHVVIGLAAVLVLALTALNVVRLVTLSRHNTELSSRIDREKAETQNLTHQAAEIRKTINKEELDSVVAAAQEANSLIDQRTFSWTAFFNRIEATLPPDVMLTSVRPSFKKGETIVTMVVLGRQVPDVDEFIEKLEATGAFNHTLPSQQDQTDQGLYRVVIDTKYEPSEAEDEPAKPSSEEPATAAAEPSATPTPPPAETGKPSQPPQAAPAAPKKGGERGGRR